MPEAYTYKWITKEAVKLEEKAQQKRVKSDVALDGDLPIRQAVFVEEYLTDFNATNAAKRAGYSEKNADKIGSELLGKTRVKEVVEERARNPLILGFWGFPRIIPDPFPPENSSNWRVPES